MSPSPEPPHDSFGDALRWWLDQRKLSAPELAQKMGVDRTLPAHWLANRKAPSVEDLVNMARELAIPQRAQPRLLRLAAEERGKIKSRRRDERGVVA